MSEEVEIELEAPDQPINDADMTEMANMYKNKIMMQAINNRLPPGFVGLSLLELAIPVMCVAVDKEDVVEALKETIEILENETLYVNMAKDVEVIKQLYSVVNDDPAGSA